MFGISEAALDVKGFALAQALEYAAGDLGSHHADGLHPELAVLALQLLVVAFSVFAVAHHHVGELGKGPAEIGIAVLGIAEAFAFAV